MGFELRCVIVPGHDDAVAAALGEMPGVTVRELDHPFVATIAAQTAEDLDDLVARYPELAADEDAAETAMNLYDITTISRRFPTLAFGRIHVDCFGGVCTYDGEVGRAGERIWRGGGHDGHQQVFAQLGLSSSSWYFQPFTRGYFDGAKSAPPARHARPITCVLRGALAADTALRSLAVAITVLGAPWQITIATERDLVVVHGDDLALSFNTGDGQLTCGGRSYVDAGVTEQLVAELVDEIEPFASTYAIELAHIGGAPIRTFERAG